MIKSLLEATGIYADGRLDKIRLLVAGLPIALFVLWRLSSQGVYGADEVLKAIERDLLMEYKSQRYREAGLLDSEPASNSDESYVVAQELHGLEVRLSNISMSGSLFSWSGNDPIGVRFDYVIESNGDIKARDRNVYRCTHRQTRTSLWECGAINYYLKYL